MPVSRVTSVLVLAGVAVVLLCACGSDETFSDARSEYCLRATCPATLVDGLQQATSDASILCHGVIEFDDGQVCLGIWEPFGGVVNCYEEGRLQSAGSYTDVIDESASPGGFGDVPLCALLYTGLPASSTCVPKPISECWICAEHLESIRLNTPLCTQQYLSELTGRWQ